MNNTGFINIGESKGYLSIKDNRINYAGNKKAYDFNALKKIRASHYIELVEKYKYPEKRLDTEVIGPRREPKLLADIVVYEDDDKEKAFLVVETKAQSTKKRH
ncbi:type I restriction enzyme HsdR N-terminal domain-containing protein [Candidatus Methylacidiphilum infernorum]|uniref:Type I restriction enzyme HsdR N-terminal domain-containing protein n=1 Tax=Candidatus Methylacidiphilum infernorum TaxID=511746 RepID=A0ABX7PT10_9BACT|nr:type I restriction enzyme HsdR N-terminal domain-containing protein [Candidatus Methylacidiphilum infernorum]QSR86106.1 type I restriction enzyme HsdR N-terminal domain-containing protein [Candidatus Methylacidiphilum infernorum]